LLINPRPTTEEFTKYSFPSKNMEYMASGTPVLTTRLPGMPEDHKPYVYFIDEETPEGVKTALQTVLSQDDQALHQFGAAAKAFILKEKNNISQAAKVLTFIQENFPHSIFK
jgi:glycosyltransferase involved in cell wall biosynthesis